jgi:2-desacetyl-2-hydroxyethyl bacteriochlorophyllide A dehydrogenase
MKRRVSLYFTAPGRVEIRDQALPPLAPEEVLVETMCSAISPGSELLVYRGLFPDDLPVDETIPALKCPFRYPARYGYSTVGRVISRGSDVAPAWENRLVFSFHHHENCFPADPAELHPLPPDISPEEALFLPTLETAVNFMMDGRPMIGEQAVVFGQGIVGLLTTALLGYHPLARLITLDREELRRRFSLEAGADTSLDPQEPGTMTALATHLRSPEGREGADVVYELSGAPEALEQALAVTGFSGRIIIGSWYGKKTAHLNLGGRFHRNRIRLISSQVSTIDPESTGRWTKSRRRDTAWSILKRVDPVRFVTHRYPFERAAEAYACLDQNPGACVQAILTY